MIQESLDLSLILMKMNQWLLTLKCCASRLFPLIIWFPFLPSTLSVIRRDIPLPQLLKQVPLHFPSSYSKPPTQPTPSNVLSSGRQLHVFSFPYYFLLT